MVKPFWVLLKTAWLLRRNLSYVFGHCNWQCDTQFYWYWQNICCHYAFIKRIIKWFFSSVGNLTSEPPKISSSTSHPDLLGGWDSWADSSATSNVASAQLKSLFEGIMKWNSLIRGNKEYSKPGQFNHMKLNICLCLFDLFLKGLHAVVLKCPFSKALV